MTKSINEQAEWLYIPRNALRVKVFSFICLFLISCIGSPTWSHISYLEAMSSRKIFLVERLQLPFSPLDDTPLLPSLRWTVGHLWMAPPRCKTSVTFRSGCTHIWQWNEQVDGRYHWAWAGVPLPARRSLAVQLSGFSALLKAIFRALGKLWKWRLV